MLKVYSTTWCGDCVRTKAFLDEKKIKFEETDIELDEKAMEFVKKTNNGNASVPTLVFDDGSTMTEPTNQELSKKLEL
ncbi:glutaredoxin family protein [Patescibacteria group bacterium]